MIEKQPLEIELQKYEEIIKNLNFDYLDMDAKIEEQSLIQQMIEEAKQEIQAIS